MVTIFDRDFARVWSDGTSPCVFCSVVRVPEKKEMDELARHQLKLIRELKHTFGNVYSILDLRLCPSIPAPIARHYVGRIVPMQFKAGLKHKAFVVPKEKKALKVLVRAFISIVDMPVSMHNSFEDAMNTINYQRTLPDPEKPRSFLSSLLARLKFVLPLVPFII